MAERRHDPGRRVDDRRGASTSFIGLGALAMFGLSVAAFAMARPRSAAGDPARATSDKLVAFRNYLRDHLVGADTAISVTGKLKKTHDATPLGELFAQLHREFIEERHVVMSLLAEIGGSSLTAKRMVGQAAGQMLETIAGGRSGELALFRSLEALAIGVQGKRLLWRAAQALEPHLSSPGARDFRHLEGLALSQWERIEQFRLALVTLTFSAEVPAPVA